MILRRNFISPENRVQHNPSETIFLEIDYF